MSAVVQFEKPKENVVTIGRSKTAAMQLDVMKLIETRVLIQANSGGGKSTLMRLIVERVAGKVPFIILDWEGEFITLREKLDVVLVGSDGEIATDIRSARLLARKLIELHASAVIDLSDLETGDRREYVRAFLESLINLPRPQWRSTIVCIDEAHQLCPEAGKVESAQAVINLMSLGRKRGLCGVLSTQRLSKLHKDAACECNNVFIGRTVLDNDQQRAGDVLGMGKAERLRLRDLAEGEFHAFGSALSHKGVLRFHADLPETRAPKVGEHRKLPVAKASDVVSHITSQLAGLPKQAEEEGHDLEAAKRRIIELERRLKKGTGNDIMPPELERLRRLKDEADNRFREVQGRLASLEAQNNTLQMKLRQIQQLSSLTEGDVMADVSISFPATQQTFIQKTPAPLRSPLSIKYLQPTPVEDVKLSKCERAILTVLAQYPEGKKKAQVAVITGYSHNGGGFNNALSTLRTRGFIEGGKEHLQITGAGVAGLGDFAALPTGRELAAYWMTQLNKAERAILENLVNGYPGTFSKETVACQTGYEPNGGGFNNALSKLRTLGLISGSKEALKASDNLF